MLVEPLNSFPLFFLLKHQETHRRSSMVHTLMTPRSAAHTRCQLFLVAIVVGLFVSECTAASDSSLPVLRVGRTLFNQSLDPFDPLRTMQEYLLDPAVVTLGHHEASAQQPTSYEVRISYLGSPAASYTIALLRRPRGRVQEEPFSTPTTRRVLLDTERVVFSLDDVRALPLDGAIEREAMDTAPHDEDIIVRVVTKPFGRRRDGNVVLPGEGVVYYNIVVEPMVFGVPQKMFPVLLCAAVLVLLSLFVIAPAVLQVLQPPPPLPALRKTE
jgi:hypothetical protein